MLAKTLILIAFLSQIACSSSSDSSSASPSDSPIQADQNQSNQNQAQLDDPADATKGTTASGLQYEVLREATGAKPVRNSVVTVDYVGTLTDGTEFDSSYARGQPATFLLANTIEGWIEGVQMMSVGSKYRFVIPPELAYGDRAVGQVIKPGDTLVFEVELLEINSN